jgi:hypothetical protein
VSLVHFAPMTQDATCERAVQQDSHVDLYRRVRAAFVAQGTSLARWCAENGVSRQYAERCLQGSQSGPKALTLRDRVIRAAGVPDA